jgi:hypothetical protein
MGPGRRMGVRTRHLKVRVGSVVEATERGEVNISAVGLIFTTREYILIYEWSEGIGTDQGKGWM